MHTVTFDPLRDDNPIVPGFSGVHRDINGRLTEVTRTPTGYLIRYMDTGERKVISVGRSA